MSLKIKRYHPLILGLILLLIFLVEVIGNLPISSYTIK
jgi:hypothetical protein